MNWVELPRTRENPYQPGAWMPVLDEHAHALVNCLRCGRGIPLRGTISDIGEVHPILECDKRSCLWSVSAILKGWRGGLREKLPPLDDEPSPKRGGRAKKGGW